jgi:hypothetical protein
MEVKKPKFENFSQAEKAGYILRLKKRMRQGYLNSDKVIDGIVEKLIGCFDKELAGY